MRTATLYNEPTCVARNATPLVLFDTMTVEALNQGNLRKLSLMSRLNVRIRLCLV
jgi:hypothetical protein